MLRRAVYRDMNRTANIIQWEYYAVINFWQANIDWLTFWVYLSVMIVFFFYFAMIALVGVFFPNTPQFREIHIQLQYSF